MPPPPNYFGEKNIYFLKINYFLKNLTKNIFFLIFENVDDVYVVDVVDDVGVDDVVVVCCFVLNKYKFMVSKSYSLTLRFASMVGPPMKGKW